MRTYEAIQRLFAMLREATPQGQRPVLPSMLALNMVQPFNPAGEGRAAQVAMRGVGALAQRLAADACEGADAPLPVPLPHTRFQLVATERGACAPQAPAFRPRLRHPAWQGNMQGRGSYHALGTGSGMGGAGTLHCI